MSAIKIMYKIGMAIVIASCLLVGPPALGQSDDSDPVMIGVDNDYIALSIGIGGKWRFQPPAYTHWMIEDQPVGGRFQIWRTGGDPDTPYDDGQPFNYSEIRQFPCPGDKWGAFQLIADAESADSDNPGRVWTYYEDRGQTGGIMGDLVDGTWIIAPYIDSENPNIIRGVWRPTPSGGITAGGEDVAIQGLPIRCELEAKLMRDTVRFKWTVHNDGFGPHLIGMRVFADLMTNPLCDGTRDGNNIVSVPGHPLIINRTLLSNRDVPSAVELFNSSSDPVTSIRLTFGEQGATMPDQVGLDNWRTVAGAGWTYWYDNTGRAGNPMLGWSYSPLPNAYIDDVGYGAAWMPRTLGGGRSVTFIHYIGLASASSDFTKPNMDKPQYVAAVQGPRTMKYYSDMGQGVLYPSPIEIAAYMFNTEKFVDIDNPSFTLTLPPGLELHPDEAGKYTKTISAVKANTEQSVRWRVIPVGRPTGILEYSVSFGGSPVGGTTVRRQINIPATESQGFRTGWQMISVPFHLNNNDPHIGLGLGGGVVWRFNTERNQYEKLGQPGTLNQLLPGEAYWLNLDRNRETSMTLDNYSARQWGGTQGFQIYLKPGWNLVGNPYIYTVTLGEVRFYLRDLGSMSYDMAIANGLISPTVFWWDPIFRRYEWSSERSVQIKPWQGYWIKALRPDVIMTINPSSQIGAAVGGVPDTGGDNPPIPPPPAP